MGRGVRPQDPTKVGRPILPRPVFGRENRVYTGVVHYRSEREYSTVMNRGARIAVGGILVLIGIAALLQYAFGFGSDEEYEHTVPLGDGVREIKIDSASLDLDIRFTESVSGENTVHVKGKAASRIVNRIRSAEVTDGVLHLGFAEPWQWSLNVSLFQAMNGKQTVTVELTEDAMSALESFRVNTGSGSLHASGAAARLIVFTSDSGGIRIDGLRSDAATVHSDSGSIRLERFEGGSLRLRTDSGSIHANEVSALLIASSDSGSVTIDHLTGTGEIRTNSGSIRVAKDDDTGLDVVSDSGSVRITVPASFGGVYDAASDSGSVSHPEPAGASGEVIRVRTDSGSIRIEH